MKGNRKWDWGDCLLAVLTVLAVAALWYAAGVWLLDHLFDAVK